MTPGPIHPRTILRTALLAAWVAFQAGAAFGATFVVDSTLDSADDYPGDGVCFSAAAGGCTLRAAIQESNLSEAPRRIRFSIPGPGVKTIQPAVTTPLFGPGPTAYWPIMEETLIDGWSQGGADYKGPPLIELDGSLLPTRAIGILINSPGTVVRGLILHDFLTGIVTSGMGRNVIQGCYIGTNATGTVARPNQIGIHMESSPENRIGGTKVEHRNVISGNIAGIYIDGPRSQGSSILGNYIGTNVTGTSALANLTTGVVCSNGSSNNFIGSGEPGGGNLISGNGQGGIVLHESNDNWVRGNSIGVDANGNGNLGNAAAGVAIYFSSNNRIGTIREGEGNTIAYNSTGVLVGEVPSNVAAGNSIRGNSIFGNDRLGISLTGGDPLLNDDLDADTGANTFLNSPELIGAETYKEETTVDGRLRGLPDAALAVDFYSSPECDDSLHGEGRKYLQSIAVTTDESGDVRFRLKLAEMVPAGRAITAVAVNLDTQDTSEFSRCAEITEPYFVTSTNDGGTGSLRQAITEANASPGMSRIHFLIPDRNPQQVIRLKSALPAITEPVKILGSTQPTFVSDPVIVIDGVASSPISSGLRVLAGDTLVEGLSIRGFAENGILIEARGDNTIRGCFIGLDGSKERNQGNGQGGIAIVASPDNTIGGVDPGEGNQIAFNAVGVRVLGNRSVGNRIRGNRIHSNAGLGIDLDDAGANANDRSDADLGANHLQNFPVLATAALQGDKVSVRGSISSEADTEYQIDFYGNLAGDAAASARMYLGSQRVQTTGVSATFDVELLLADPALSEVTATATRATAPFDTSEIARARTIRQASSRQVPGDCNQDARLDISDASCLLGFLFQGNPGQLPCGDGTSTDPANVALMDWQPDGKADLSDAVALLDFLFSSGSPHPLSLTGNPLRGCVDIPGCPEVAACPVE